MRRDGRQQTALAQWSAWDHGCMQLALAAARDAAAEGEVPVGAVLARDGRVVAVAHNRRETLGDPTAHAEVLAIREAARAGSGWRLDGATLYVTLEPCPMCAGALWLARVERLVFGAADERAGAAGSVYNVAADARLNHRVRIEAGLEEDAARALLRGFFRDLRCRPRAGAPGERRTEGCPSG